MLATGTGRYAGQRVSYGWSSGSIQGTPRYQDVVLTKDRIMCEPGTSGSSFSYSVTGGSSSRSKQNKPLKVRTGSSQKNKGNSSSTSKRKVTYTYNSGALSGVIGESLAESPTPSLGQGSEIGRLVIEGELNIDTTGYKICLFTKSDARALLNGVGVRPPEPVITP